MPDQQQAQVPVAVEGASEPHEELANSTSGAAYELETSGEASLRHPELEESRAFERPELERTPRSWDDWARGGRPRHPELDSDEEGLDTRPGIVVL